MHISRAKILVPNAFDVAEASSPKQPTLWADVGVLALITAACILLALLTGVATVMSGASLEGVMLG